MKAETQILNKLKSVRFELMNSCDPAIHQRSLRWLNEVIDRMEYELSKEEWTD